MKKLLLLLLLILIGCTEKNPINIDLLRSSKDYSIYYSKETNEPYSGPVFYLDKDNNIFLQGSLKDGEKTGEWIYWDRYGKRIEGIVLKEVRSNFTGVMFDFFYFENNMFVSYVPYEKGIKEGIYTKYLDGDWLKERGFYQSIVREEGTYENNLKEGPFTWDVEKGEFEGDRVEGTFKNGVQEGPYVYYFSSGSREEGTYRNGIKEEPSVYYFSSGSREERTFKNGVQEGPYVYYFSDGSREEGTYRNGVIEGFFIMYYKKGDRIEGTYKNGVKEGPCVYYFSDGSREEGTYRNGVRSF